MENFVHIEKSLLKALNKCHTKLNQFKNGEVNDLENWNKWHDLNVRIEERIKENIKIIILGILTNTGGMLTIFKT